MEYVKVSYLTNYFLVFDLYSIWYFYFGLLGFAIDCYVCLDPECWNQTLSSNQPGDYFGKIEKCDSDKSCYTAKVGGRTC